MTSMEYDLVLLSDASIEIEETIVWYENQKEGLGRQFGLAIKKAFDSLKANPLLYAKVQNDIRRVLLNKFPYSVYYLIDEEKLSVVIFAILHQSQNPNEWQSRVSKD